MMAYGVLREQRERTFEKLGLADDAGVKCLFDWVEFELQYVVLQEFLKCQIQQV